MPFADPEDEAFGPTNHGDCVIVLPQESNGSRVRAAYVEMLEASGCPHGTTPKEFDDPSDMYRRTKDTYFVTAGAHSLVLYPNSGEHSAQALSRRLQSPLLFVQPLGKAYIWTYVLYTRGHMVSRFASCPEWIPDGNLGDLDFEEYEAIHGREKALRDYTATWAGDTEEVARLFRVSPSRLEPYLCQFTFNELEEWNEKRGKYSETKVHASDRYSLASPWVFVHFIEQLGIPGFRDIYWDPFPVKDIWSGPPVYTPTHPASSANAPKAPPCATEPFPFSGFFWNHSAHCPGLPE